MGGSETVSLTVEQIPSHSHGNGLYNRLLRVKADCTATAPGIDNTCGEPDIITSQPISFTGGNQPHSNMPPYIVLKACKKVSQFIEVTNTENQVDRSLYISVIALVVSILEGIVLLLKIIKECK